jgi:hypothetical protein
VEVGKANTIVMFLEKNHEGLILMMSVFVVSKTMHNNNIHVEIINQQDRVKTLTSKTIVEYTRPRESIPSERLFHKNGLFAIQ